MRKGGSPSERRIYCARGSSLLGVSAILFALSVGFAVALPAFQRTQRITRARAVAADLKQFEQAFQRYAHDHGDWPSGSTAPSAIPAGMEQALSATRWTTPTPIGGRYIWFTHVVEAGERPRAAIAIVSTPTDPVSDDQRQLDALMQAAPQAHLDTHELRLGVGKEPVYVLEQ